MMAVRHVVFDLVHVLLNFDPALAYHDLLPDPDDRHDFLTRVCSRDWITQQDRADCWAPGEDALVDRFADHEHLIRAFRRDWQQMVPSHIDGGVAVPERLAGAGTDLTALTNFNGEMFDETVPRFEWFGHFRAITVSGKAGLLKPERAIFDHHVEGCGLDPAATLFIDDLQAKVDAAIAAGWQAIRFTCPKTLENDLQRRGLTL